MLDKQTKNLISNLEKELPNIEFGIKAELFNNENDFAPPMDITWEYFIINLRNQGFDITRL